MPVLRNVRSSTNKTLTIRRFIAGEVVTTNVYPFLWLGINDTYIGYNDTGTRYNHVGFKEGASVIIRCEVATDANGPVCGITGKSRIVAESGYIKWYDDDNTLCYSVANDGKQHDLGFLFDVNTTRPFFDGVVNATMVLPSVERDFIVGGLAANSSNGGQTGTCITSSSTYAIKVYEIEGLFCQRNMLGDENFNFMHFYACGAYASVSAGFMFDTRHSTAVRLEYPSDSSGTRGLGALENPYGVSLNDLQTALGSPYEQLLAVIGQDNGVDRGGVGAEDKHAGWLDPVATNEDKTVNADTAQIVTTTEGGVTRSLSLAFYLQAAYLPAGATITNPTDVNDYENGDLIRGRQPKWNLWDMNLKGFKHIKQVSSGAYGQNYSYQFRYNIFKDIHGNNIFSTNEPDMMAVFDKYTTSDVAHYAPRLEATGLAVIHSYNSLPYIKDKENMYRANKERSSKAYINNEGEGDGIVKGVLGNLPYWNFTQTQQGSDLYVYGLIVRGAIKDGASATGYRDIVSLVKSESSPLSADSTAAIKTAYQQTGVTARLKSSTLSDSARMFAENGVFNIYYMLGALRSAVSGQVSESQIIDCSKIVPQIKSQSIIQQYNEDILLIGERNAGGKAYMDNNTYNIFISEATGDASDNFVELNSVTRKFLGFRFALYDNTRNKQVLYNNVSGTSDPDMSNPKFLAYIEYTRMASPKSYLLSNDYAFVDSRTDLPQGNDLGSVKSIYVVRQGMRVFRRVAGKYNNVDMVTYPTVNDFPDDLTVYKTTDEPIMGRVEQFVDKIYINIWNQYKTSRRYEGNTATHYDEIRQITGSGGWPSSSDAQSTLIYYKAYGDDEEDDRYYLWRRVNGSFSFVKANVVHLPNKESFPKLGNYYIDASTGDIYRNYYFPQSSPYSKGFYNNYVQVTLHSYSQKSDFPDTGSTGNNIYYAQDTETYYDWDEGTARNARYHEDELQVGTLPASGSVGIVYKDGGRCYRWNGSAFVEISPYFAQGEMIERRAMFTKTFAFNRSTSPYWPNPYLSNNVLGMGDTKYLTLSNANTDTSDTIENDDYSHYATALFYQQDLMQLGADSEPSSRYNNYTDGNDPIVHPRTMEVKLYEKATAPHAWCAYTNQAGYMSDKVENWMFNIGTFSDKTYCYFLLNGDYSYQYLIPYGNTAVVQAMMGLCYKNSNVYESYTDVESTAANFKPFKLSLYKQLPTEPYVMQNNNAVFDDTHNITTVFENVPINTPNYTYNKNDSGCSALGNYYTVKVSSDKILEGYRMQAGGTMKTGIFNDTCFALEVFCSGTIEPGATYLIKISN